MSKRKNIIVLITVFIFIIVFFLVFTAIRIHNIPNELFITGKNKHTLNFNLPLTADVTTDSYEVINFNGTTLENTENIKLNKPITISSNKSGETKVDFKIFGFLSIKKIKITVSDEILLYPGGQSIGVMLQTDGALVVANSYITLDDGKQICPAEECGLLPGDIIKRADGIEINSAEHLTNIINDCSEPTIDLEISRSNKLINLKITPVLDKNDGIYKLGAWVRDSTVGVGTLTYYDPNSNTFAGLGHSINDADTGEMLTIKNGEIINSKIIEIVKGSEGSPGELKGLFDPLTEVLGNIESNTNYGIFGKAKTEIKNNLFSKPIPIASKDEIVIGDASICCTLQNNIVQEYSCTILKTQKQNSFDQKNFLIEITDENLLNQTGGIVQGMSGSPIIQDGKLVGAVTHVLVNDPTRGYGIFIENMLDAAG